MTASELRVVVRHSAMSSLGMEDTSTLRSASSPFTSPRSPVLAGFGARQADVLHDGVDATARCDIALVGAHEERQVGRGFLEPEMNGFTASAGAAPGSPALSRRTLLRASPALLAPVALTACVTEVLSAPTDTSILRLYREQERLALALNTGSGDEATDNAIFADLLAAERQMADEPCTCLADLAAKVLVLTQLRDSADTPYIPALLEDMEALVAGALA